MQLVRSVLVVDDDKDTAHAMSKLLRAMGYLAVTAGTLVEAKALCEERDFDLLLLDLSLPDGRGTELLDARSDSDRPKVIIISGHDIDSPGAIGVSGFNDYLVKPILFEDLVKAVQRAFGDDPSR